MTISDRDASIGEQRDRSQPEPVAGCCVHRRDVRPQRVDGTFVVGLDQCEHVRRTPCERCLAGVEEAFDDGKQFAERSRASRSRNSWAAAASEKFGLACAPGGGFDSASSASTSRPSASRVPIWRIAASATKNGRPLLAAQSYSAAVSASDSTVSPS